MAKCETCGTACTNPFVVRVDRSTHIYDSLECIIFGLAPRCASCNELVINRGIRSQGLNFCCPGCALSQNSTININ